jgi:VPS28 protein
VCAPLWLQMVDLPADFTAKRRLLDWISKLNKQSAAYELDAGEARQLEHDLTSSYTEWQQTLK